MLGNGIKEVRWDLARLPQQNGFWGSYRDIMKKNIPERGRAFKSQVIRNGRVSPADLAGARVSPR